MAGPVYCWSIWHSPGPRRPGNPPLFGRIPGGSPRDRNPRYLWWPILHGLILTLRPKKLVPRYRGIWMDEGSPLMVYSRRQAEGAGPAAGGARRAGRGGAGHARMARHRWPTRWTTCAARLRAYPGRAALPAIGGQHDRHGRGRRHRPCGAPARPAGAALHQALSRRPRVPAGGRGAHRSLLA